MYKLKTTIAILILSITSCFLYGAKKQRPIPSDIIKVNGPYNRDYFVLLPKDYDPNKRYWLFVAVHGYTGNGMVVQKQRNFPFRSDCIIVGPSFPQTESEGYYQMLGGNSDKQLLKIVDELKKKYKLHDRFLLYGFSGGSQFCHRFTMKNHKFVLACSAHSGGSWGEPNTAASYLPFAISCGEMDRKVSRGAPADRLTLYRDFYDKIRKDNFFYTAKVRPSEAHAPGAWVKEKTTELFAIATTGLFPKQKKELDSKIKKIKQLIQEKEYKKAKLNILNLKAFKPSKLKYNTKPIDDTDKQRREKFSEKKNQYGYTTNRNAENYMSERLQYYLTNIVIPSLTNELNNPNNKQ
jgi:hypothetical protein